MHHYSLTESLRSESTKSGKEADFLNSYIFTVADLMELPIMEGATILAGKSGLHRRITSATVFDAPDGLQWLKGNEMVISTLYPFKDDLELQIYFITKLCQGGAAALGIKLDRYFHSLPPEVIKVANEHDFPIISLPYHCAWVEIINPILAEVMNRQLLELKRSQEIHNSLTDLVLKGGTLQSIADVLHKLVNNPVLICDYITDNLVLAPKGFSHYHHVVASTSLEKDDDIAVRKSIRNSVEKIVSNNDTVKYVMPIRVEKGMGGRIVVFEDQRKLHRLDIIAIEHAATVAALYLQREKAIHELEQRFRNDFIFQLLSGDYLDYASCLTIAQGLGWQLQEQNIVLVCGMKKQDPRMANNYFQYAVNHCLRQILREDQRILCGLYLEGSLVIIYPNIDLDKDELYQQVARIGGMVVDSLRTKFNKPFYAGIGRLAYTISDIPRSYQEACLAQLVCPAIGDGNYVLNYDQCGIFRLLHIQANSPEAQKYLEDYILPIVAWDKNHQEELLHTLEVLVGCRGNIRMAARKLYLHHNSIRYRISKIEKNFRL
jgi:purine catabolism regulator